MMSARWLLVFAILTLIATLVAGLRRREVPVRANIPLWLLGFPVTELTAIVAALQALVVLCFASFGALGEPVGALGMTLMLLAWGRMYQLHRLARQSGPVLQRALDEGLGGDFREAIPAGRRVSGTPEITLSTFFRPFRFSRPGVIHEADIAYGDAGERNLLDIYRPASTPAAPCPVLLQVHGGGWTVGHKQEQAQPLMYCMARRGWVCVAINYRLSPQFHFPAHIIDVKKAIAWVREHIAGYGGDPGYIAITGGSAGGHLTALAALSANDPAYQGGFEDVDTRVAAAIPFYGVYDFLEHEGQPLNRSMKRHLETKVIGCTPKENPELWRQASPVERIRADAPPFMVIQGECDTMVSRAAAEHFSRQLCAVSAQPVVFAGLPGAHHAFDIPNSVRTEHTIWQVAQFLEWAYARRGQ
ncbi:MAG: alpha/beta hydrolase fold domain-containing protein [Parahaliea sp.]